LFSQLEKGNAQLQYFSDNSYGFISENNWLTTKNPAILKNSSEDEVLEKPRFPMDRFAQGVKILMLREDIK
jgi:hypothetical protein